uniref:Uncharacterized protein n=1 Tax=Odontella aurita TaxID=265563 RepID=A0A7S4JT79_9STRA
MFVDDNLELLQVPSFQLAPDTLLDTRIDQGVVFRHQVFLRENLHNVNGDFFLEPFATTPLLQFLHRNSMGKLQSAVDCTNDLSACIRNIVLRNVVWHALDIDELDPAMSF